MSNIDNTNNIIDVRDIIQRVEELRDVRLSYVTELAHFDAPVSPNLTDDEAEELGQLESLMSDLCGMGGDEKWEGNWYPVTLIRDDYFETHAQELAEDCGMVDRKATWPNNCIDWERAARELRMDYSSVEIDGVTYWTR
jgi:Antirestriction protein (ArdA)